MVALDRGVQMESFRVGEKMTDVLLVCGDTTELPCHKLVLSLHSSYFRTLFQSSGFIESHQTRIALNHIKPQILQSLISFIYTGSLDILPDTAVDILEATTVLQLECREITEEISAVLKTLVIESVRFEQIFYIWNIAVTYELSDVLECVMAELETKLESFITNTEDMAWLNMLGWEEMKEIITRNGLCLQSESLLLDFVLNWAKDKVSNIEDYQSLTELLLNLRLSLLDKKYVRTQVKLQFPDYCEMLPIRFNSSLTLKHARSCYNCYYMAQYKLSSTQIRNIEDFVDSGQKSLFLGFNLYTMKVTKLKSMTNFSSMVGTAAGNYGRPVTRDSFTFQWRHLLVVVGGVSDGDKTRLRGDILLYNTESMCWVTSLKQFIRQKPHCSLYTVVQVADSLFLFWRSSAQDSPGLVERLSLETACSEYKVDKVLVTEIPQDLNGLTFGCVAADKKIVCVGQSCSLMLDTESFSWSRLAPAIGSIGEASPVLAWAPPHIFLVSGRMEDSTNILQSLDTASGQWRRLPNLDTRMTVLQMFSHNDCLHLLGWQPARNNFLLSLDKRTGASKVILSGLEGVWARGVVARGQHLSKMLS